MDVYDGFTCPRLSEQHQSIMPCLSVTKRTAAAPSCCSFRFGGFCHVRHRATVTLSLSLVTCVIWRHLHLASWLPEKESKNKNKIKKRKQERAQDFLWRRSVYPITDCRINFLPWRHHQPAPRLVLGNPVRQTTPFVFSFRPFTGSARASNNTLPYSSRLHWSNYSLESFVFFSHFCLFSRSIKTIS